MKIQKISDIMKKPLLNRKSVHTKEAIIYVPPYVVILPVTEQSVNKKRDDIFRQIFG